MPLAAALAATLLSLLWCASAHTQDEPQDWRESGQRALQAALSQRPITRPAKNVILFIGDGMGVSTVTAARILEGQQRGEPGEENALSFETLPYSALAKTYNTNQQTPDSAGTMTAIMTGVKTKAGLIGLDQRVTRQACRGLAGSELESLLRQFERAGRSTGIVSTARITHATPAATYARSPERNWESDRELTKRARRAGCRDIAQQLLDHSLGDGLEVALGGGRRSFLPSETTDPEYKEQTGSRQDGRDLTAEWLQNHPRSAYVWNSEQFHNINPLKVDHLLGLFEPSHMQFEHERASGLGAEPSLSEMTAKAIAILQRNPEGFFLMVEGGRIDHGHHKTNAYRALTETIELSEAVKVAQSMTDSGDSLLIVTADHSHTFMLSGYPTRGNPILGKVRGNDPSGEAKRELSLARDGLPYTTASYANGPIHTSGEPHTGLRRNLEPIDTQSADFNQDALIPLYAETHSAEDVTVYAAGPWAHLFQGTLEQHFIYYVMHYASLGLGSAGTGEQTTDTRQAQ